MNQVLDLPRAHAAPVQMPIMSVAEMTERINAIQSVTRQKMIQDVHYGIIPGTKKPTLYKAGSEMLLVMFQIGPEVSVLDLTSAERIKYRVTTTGIHIPTGNRIGQGVGECSSGEEKYKWRNAVCDDEFEDTPDTHRRIKWAKVWGRDGNPNFLQSKQVRVVPDDIGNTVLKMAKKRAQIDMTLTALGVSDLFNQDIEDLPPELRPHAADESGNGGGATMAPGPAEHAGLKAAKSVADLVKVMNAMQQADKKKYVAYFNVRMQEMKEAGK